ncbi:MAG: hypothetical protein IKD50_04565, partial [Clostridia bacterium]|nr:hypothetical protein [Clostridia bacterium]
TRAISFFILDTTPSSLFESAIKLLLKLSGIFAEQPAFMPLSRKRIINSVQSKQIIARNNPVVNLFFSVFCTLIVFSAFFSQKTGCACLLMQAQLSRT